MIKEGDVILTRSGHKFGKSIRWIMNLCQDDPVLYNHVIYGIDDETGFEAVSTLKYCDLKKTLANKDAYKIIRYKGLTKGKAQRMTKVLTKLENRPYSVSRILLQIPDQIFNTNFFTKLNKDKNSQVCSSCVAWVYYVWCKIKINGVSWRSAEPDDFDDESLKNPEMWEVVEEYTKGEDK